MSMTAYTLNLIDLALTLHALNHGGVELNPLMRNPAVMVAYKVIGVGLFCLSLEIIARNKRIKASDNARKIARWGLRFCTGVFSVYFIGHLFFIFGGAYLWRLFS